MTTTSANGKTATTVELAPIAAGHHFSFGAIHPLQLAEAIVAQSEDLIAGKPLAILVPPLSQEVNFLGRTFDAVETLTITITQKT